MPGNFAQPLATPPVEKCCSIYIPVARRERKLLKKPWGRECCFVSEALIISPRLSSSSCLQLMQAALPAIGRQAVEDADIGLTVSKATLKMDGIFWVVKRKSCLASASLELDRSLEVPYICEYRLLLLK